MLYGLLVLYSRARSTNDKMITVATDEDTFSIDGDLSMTLEDLQAILEADVRCYTLEQSRLELTLITFSSRAFQQHRKSCTAMEID